MTIKELKEIVSEMTLGDIVGGVCLFVIIIGITYIMGALQ